MQNTKFRILRQNLIYENKEYLFGVKEQKLFSKNTRLWIYLENLFNSKAEIFFAINTKA
jgi:hypothetical protein